jgi:chorismate synthase
MQRDEKDKVTIMSGTEKGFTLGTPIGMMVPNEDQRPHDYGEMDFYPRPSHADWTYLEKYGIKASSGGGRSSARETIGRVAASAVAEKYLNQAFGIEIVGFVSSVGHVSLEPMEDYDSAKKETWIQQWKTWWKTLKTITREQVDANEVRCPDEVGAQRMRDRIIQAKDDNNSIGGCVTCVIRNLPAGLGEPCFDK